MVLWSLQQTTGWEECKCAEEQYKVSKTFWQPGENILSKIELFTLAETTADIQGSWIGVSFQKWSVRFKVSQLLLFGINALIKHYFIPHRTYKALYWSAVYWGGSAGNRWQLSATLKICYGIWKNIYCAKVIYFREGKTEGCSWKSSSVWNICHE